MSLMLLKKWLLFINNTVYLNKTQIGRFQNKKKKKKKRFHIIFVLEIYFETLREIFFDTKEKQARLSWL